MKIKNWDKVSILMEKNGTPSIPCKKVTDLIRDLDFEEIDIYHNGNPLYEVKTDKLTGKCTSVFVFEN